MCLGTVQGGQFAVPKRTALNRGGLSQLHVLPLDASTLQYQHKPSGDIQLPENTLVFNKICLKIPVLELCFDGFAGVSSAFSYAAYN